MRRLLSNPSVDFGFEPRDAAELARTELAPPRKAVFALQLVDLVASVGDAVFENAPGDQGFGHNRAPGAGSGLRPPLRGKEDWSP
jgi:hypothetical protein